jgi:UrcA family protein
MFSPQRHSISKASVGRTAALAAGLIGLLPLGAIAAQVSQPAVDGPVVVVKYADLDINTPRDAEKLIERIEHAAVQLCPQVDFMEIERYAASLRCRNDVVARAVSSINSPQLAAVYASRFHHVAHSPV